MTLGCPDLAPAVVERMRPQQQIPLLPIHQRWLPRQAAEGTPTWVQPLATELHQKHTPNKAHLNTISTKQQLPAPCAAPAASRAKLYTSTNAPHPYICCSIPMQGVHRSTHNDTPAEPRHSCAAEPLPAAHCVHATLPGTKARCMSTTGSSHSNTPACACNHHLVKQRWQ